jgi:hypothetical protein
MIGYECDWCSANFMKFNVSESSVISFLWCCILFMVLTNKNGGVTVTQTNIFISQITKYFGPDRPFSGDS